MLFIIEEEGGGGGGGGGGSVVPRPYILILVKYMGVSMEMPSFTMTN